MMEMMGAMRTPALAALRTSEPRRSPSLSVFRDLVVAPRDCGCATEVDVGAEPVEEEDMARPGDAVAGSESFMASGREEREEEEGGVGFGGPSIGRHRATWRVPGCDCVIPGIRTAMGRCDVPGDAWRSNNNAEYGLGVFGVGLGVVDNQNFWGAGDNSKAETGGVDMYPPGDASYDVQ